MKHLSRYGRLIDRNSKINNTFKTELILLGEFCHGNVRDKTIADGGHCSSRE